MIIKLLLLYFIPWLILVFATYFIMEKPANLYNLLFDPCEHMSGKDDSYYCCYFKWFPVANIGFIFVYALIFTLLFIGHFVEVCDTFLRNKCAPFLKKYLSRITIK